jgi:hypothetical protein
MLTGLAYHGGTKKVRKGISELIAALFYDHDGGDLK